MLALSVSISYTVFPGLKFFMLYYFIGGIIAIFNYIVSFSCKRDLRGRVLVVFKSVHIKIYQYYFIIGRSTL